MLYLLIVSLLWSFSFAIIKAGLEGLDANLVAAIRLLFALLLFLPFLRLRGLSKKDLLQLLSLGAVQFGVMYSLYTACFAHLPAHLIALLTTTTPLMVVFFNMFLEGRNIPAFWVGSILAVIGGAVLRYSGGYLDISWYGVLLLQLSNAAFALGQLWYKRFVAARPGWRDREAFALIYAGGAITCLLLAAGTTEWSSLAAISVQQWWLLAYLGLIASGFCFFLWNRGATQVNPGILGLMNNLKIPLGVLLSVLLLREPCNFSVLALSLLLFLGAFYLCREKKHS